MKFKTYSPKSSEVKREWYIIDATNQVLGRLASQVAHILRGKHKPSYAPHMDMGDFVVIVNADKVRLTGRKLEAKSYFRHTGYPGGGRTETVREAFKKHPEQIIQKAVKGMLPHNRLGRRMIKKLKVYASSDHPHQAQSPKQYELKG